LTLKVSVRYYLPMNDKIIDIKPPATVHLIGICGTGMGSLAGLLKSRGFTVTGSDAHAYPPMSTELERMGVEIMEGYNEKNLAHRPDIVVVGNVCRVDHPEAVAARKLELRYVSLPQIMHDLFLSNSKPLVIAGTHGKTTTTALTAYLLEAVSRDPSVFVGGITNDFGSGQKLGNGDFFVIEGDEYDSAYFEKIAKFLSYSPYAAALTSVEHDHIDIYPTETSYKDAFKKFVNIVTSGPIAVYAGDKGAMEVVSGAKTKATFYAVKGDPYNNITPQWLATMLPGGEFNLTVNGSDKGFWKMPMEGRHNLRNTLAALILACEAAKVPLDDLRKVLPDFKGVARRQQVVATPNGITIYDDFAHHPTAVRETIAALAQKHPEGKLLVAFEPRSATACRSLHQSKYLDSFAGASLAVIAPVGRNIPDEEKLDTKKLARELGERGIKSLAAKNFDEVAAALIAQAEPGDIIALLSNGSFGSLHQKIAQKLK